MEMRISFNIFVVAEIVFLISLTGPSHGSLSQKDRLKKIQVYFYSPLKKTEIGLQKIMTNEGRHWYDPKLPMKLLIHGWMGSRNHITIDPVKNAYLSMGGHNLLVVDWSSGAGQNYDLSRALVPYVAKRVAKVLRRFLQTFGIPVQTVHILGHSLGAHIAGNIGKSFGGAIGRITALDPAGPLFLKSSPDACSRLDAQFVDAIHTDVGVLGEFAQRGHVDFYPNRGFPPQPGCFMLDLITASCCSHYRAPLLYAESILIENSFIATQCSRDELYHSISECKPKRSEVGVRRNEIMGEYVSRNASGIYYLQTNNSPPYGKGFFLN